MTARMITVITACALGIAFLCVGGLTALTGTAAACVLYPAPGGATSGYDADQLHNAAVIVTVGARRAIPVRGQIIAVAAAMQESNLRNLGFLGDRNDHDSLGLFQQRPSQGWGTPQQITNPEYASGRFYDKLLTIPNWEKMSLTVAAQAVQVSAYPDAYAKHEPAAATIVNAVASQGSWAIPGDLEQCVSTAGWTHPLPGHKVTSGFHTAERPSHDGVDLPAPRGTPIRAAASGVVIRVLCDANLDSQCDVDGSPQIPGCGWFSEIRSGEFIHRYCHQLVRPGLVPGQTVAVGQVIGVVGTSGHSSGPHLHLEIHKGSLATSQNAISPLDHFLSMGIDLNG